MDYLMRVWHYTVGTHIPSILKEGVIRVEDTTLSFAVKSACWFSTSQDFERTACKLGLTPKGERYGLTVEETEHFGHGLYRIEAGRQVRLHPFSRYRRLLGASKGLEEMMDRAGRKMGGDPAQWRFSLHPVPRAQWGVVQKRIDGIWTDVDL